MSATTKNEPEKVNVSLDRESYQKLQALKSEKFGGENGVSHSRAIYYMADTLLNGDTDE